MENESIKKVAPKKSFANNKKEDSVSHSQSHHSHIEEEKFSFQIEAQKVQDLARDLPATKTKLIEILSQEDHFKQGEKEVRPHSIDELTQNQIGAVKVLALKALMEQDTDDETLKKDLNHIIKNAKDPTIVKIARAAKGSIDQGRSFFDDFVEAVSRM